MTPAGCRPEDQEAYQDLIKTIDGVNAADLHPDEKKGTCYQNQWYLEKDYGQRIDHIIVQKDLADMQHNVRIKQFKTLQEFGGGRKGSSDHCPLFCQLERGASQDAVVAAITTATEKECKRSDDRIMRDIDRLAQTLKTQIKEELTNDEKKTISVAEPSKAFLSEPEYESVMGEEEEICLADHDDDDDIDTDSGAFEGLPDAGH